MTIADTYGIDTDQFAADRHPVVVTDDSFLDLFGDSALQTDRLGRGQPSMAQIGGVLYILDGINQNKAYDGTALIPASEAYPRILIHGEKIGADYDKDHATYKYYVQLDDGAVFADDRLIGTTITLTNGTNTDEGIILDSWKAYSGAPYDGKPVVKIAVALSYDFVAVDTTYKIQHKHQLTATEDAKGNVDAGQHMYLIAAIDKSRKRESATPEIHENDDYGDLEFYLVTVASPNNAVRMDMLFKPPSIYATHWRIYGTEADQDVFYHINDVPIGTWDGTKEIVMRRPDSWLRTRPKRETLHHPFPTASVVVARKNKIFVGGTEVVSAPGTLTLTKNKRYFSVADGALTEQMEDLHIQAAGTARAYQIRVILDATHGILYDAALATSSGVAFRIFGWERTMFPSEIDPNTGEARPEGTRLYRDALELPISHGGRIVAAASMPGEDILVFSEEECVRITGRASLDAVNEFQEGILGKPGLVAAGNVTAGLNHKGIIASAYGTTPRLLSAKVPRQFSDEIVDRKHHWRAPGLAYTSQGGTPWAIWFMAPAGEQTLDLGMIVKLTDEEWTSIRGVAATALGLLTDEDGIERPVVGDCFGMLYWFQRAQSATNNSMGAQSSRRRGVADATSTTLQLVDLTQMFNTTGSGERGCPVWLIDGTGAGQMRFVYSNTATVIVPHKAFDPAPDATTVYHLGALRGRGKRAWTNLGYPVSHLKDVLYLDFIVKGDDPLYGGDTSRVQFTRGSTTVKAIGSLTFAAAAVGQALLKENDFENIGWVKAVADAGKTLTLVSAWTGDTGGAPFTVGAQFLSVNLRYNMDDSEIEKTIYVPMNVPLVSAQLGLRVSTLQVEFITYDEGRPEIWDITPRFETE